jgi:hypothetical protein
MARWRRILRASREEITIQEAVHAVLRQSEARLTEISNRTGVAYETLRNYTCDPRQPGGTYCSLPVHMIAPVTNATGNYAILDTLEAACGRVAFRAPEVTEPSVDLLREVAEAAREFGDLASTVAAAIGDRRVTAEELARIDEEGYELIQHTLRTMLAARAASEAQE